MHAKTIIQDMLALAGVTINGDNPWDMTIHDERFYGRMLSNAELAFGETYQDGWWDCQELDQLVTRIFRADLERKILKHPKFYLSYLRHSLSNVVNRVFNFQSKDRSFEVAKRHYDIGNDLYKSMLDRNMVYTCGYWEDAATLDEAQIQKLDLCCRKLSLQPGMTILDVGCGWGSFAQYAAKHYGVSVVGITISKEQIELAQKRCEGLPVTIRFQDYRDLLQEKTKYDRVISLGMFEHVGSKNYETYMKAVCHSLKNDGLFLLHTIGGNISQTTTNSWIRTYIFPNGQIPSIAQIATSFEGVFVMEDWHNFGSYYDKTLMAWYQNFKEHWGSLKDHYDERFFRMWRFYLLSCAGSFRARENQLWQIVLSKEGLPNGFQYGKLRAASEPKLAGVPSM